MASEAKANKPSRPRSAKLYCGSSGGQRRQRPRPSSAGPARRASPPGILPEAAWNPSSEDAFRAHTDEGAYRQGFFSASPPPSSSVLERIAHDCEVHTLKRDLAERKNKQRSERVERLAVEARLAAAVVEIRDLRARLAAAAASSGQSYSSPLLAAGGVRVRGDTDTKAASALRKQVAALKRELATEKAAHAASDARASRLAARFARTPQPLGPPSPAGALPLEAQVKWAVGVLGRPVQFLDEEPPKPERRRRRRRPRTAKAAAPAAGPAANVPTAGLEDQAGEPLAEQVAAAAGGAAAEHEQGDRGGAPASEATAEPTKAAVEQGAAAACIQRRYRRRLRLGEKIDRAEPPSKSKPNRGGSKSKARAARVKQDLEKAKARFGGAPPASKRWG